jgi:polysaccharide biosynthesis transport protein
LLIFVFGFIVSLAGGMGVIILKENIDKTIHGPALTGQIIGELPLVTIPYIVTAEEMAGSKRLLRYALFATSGTVLLVILLVHILYMPMDVLWYVALRKLGL